MAKSTYMLRTNTRMSRLLTKKSSTASGSLSVANSLVTMLTSGRSFFTTLWPCGVWEGKREGGREGGEGGKREGGRRGREEKEGGREEREQREGGREDIKMERERDRQNERGREQGREGKE